MDGESEGSPDISIISFQVEKTVITIIKSYTTQEGLIAGYLRIVKYALECLTRHVMSMIPDRKISRDEMLIYSMFILILAVVGYLIVTGEVWVIVPPWQMSIWIIFASVFIAMLGGVVATYSFEAYMQKPETRYIVLGLLGFDIIFIAFAFLFTHPSCEIWIPFFPDRQRNRSIVIIFGMALIPSVLSGAFKGEVPAIKEKSWMILLWGGVIVPAFVFWFSLSPEAVIISTDTSDAGGIFSATIAGAAMIGIVMIAFIVSFARYLIRWFRGGDRITLGSALSLFIWIISLILLGILDDPLLTLEVVWYTLIGCGFLIIAMTMIVTTIIEPHKALNELVADRTRKLEISEQESEFYLDMWSHKVGNILQGMMTYLELISRATQDEGTSDAIDTAKELGQEANLVNRQVINLIQIKNSQEAVIGPRNLLEHLRTAAQKAMLFRESVDIKIQFDVDHDVYAEADDLLNLLFLSLFINTIQKVESGEIVFDVTLKATPDSVIIYVTNSCQPLTADVIDYLSETEHPTLMHMGLELFMIRLLLNRYNGTVECLTDESSIKDRLAIRLVRSRN